MKQPSKRYGALVVALTMAALLAACGNGASGKDATTTYKGVYAQDPQTFDYSVTGMSIDSDHLANFEEPLMTTDRYGKIVPGLAKSFKVSNNGKTYTYTLRKNVKWVDSQGNVFATVKPQDFITGIKHAVSGKSAVLYVIQDSIVGLNDYVTGKNTDFSKVGVKVVGKDKIQFNLTRPEPYWNSKVQYGVTEPINAKFLKQQGKRYGQTKPGAILYDGPFIASNVTSKSVIEYKANPHYWNKKNVFVKDVKLTYNDASNPDALYKSFIKGDLTQARVYPNLPGYKAVLKQSKNNIIWSKQSAGSGYIMMNVARHDYTNTAKKTTKQREDTRKAMLNQDFRLALNYALDRKAYNAQTVGEAGASRSLRSEITPPDFVKINGKDYGTYVQSALKKIDPATFGKVNLADGQDGLYNKPLAKSLFAKAKQALSAEGVAFPIHVDLPQNEKDTLHFNQSRSFKHSIETALGKGNVVIDIVPMSFEKYQTAGPDSNFDIFTGFGWAPDYQDPSTYLDIYKPADGASLDMLGLDPDSTRPASLDAQQAAAAKQTGLDKFQDQVNHAETITEDMNARYKAFADAEATLMSTGVIIPISSGGGLPSVTRIVPFTANYSWQGQPTTRYDLMKLQSKPVTIKQYNAAMKKWEAKQ